MARGQQLVVDEAATMPGRGAWVHPSSDCVEKAVKRRAFGRALKVSVALDTTLLENRLNGSDHR